MDFQICKGFVQPFANHIQQLVLKLIFYLVYCFHSFWFCCSASSRRKCMLLVIFIILLVDRVITLQDPYCVIVNRVSWCDDRDQDSPSCQIQTWLCFLVTSIIGFLIFLMMRQWAWFPGDDLTGWERMISYGQKWDMGESSRGYVKENSSSPLLTNSTNTYQAYQV